MKNVLFINSRLDVQNRVKEILSREEDYNLIIAETTQQACDILDNGDINFVLFDVDVALNEGVNKMTAMKEKYPNIPIVATTPINKE